jgi:hypothetical protein
MFDKKVIKVAYTLDKAKRLIWGIEHSLNNKT